MEKPLKQMMALRAVENLDGQRYEFVALPRPTPRTYEVLIEVRAIGLAPEILDPNAIAIASGPGEARVLAMEIAGRVIEVGYGVSGFHIDDNVFGTVPVSHPGAAATLVATPETHLAKMPQWLSFAQAATLPIAGLSSWQALVEHSHVKPGQTVLVHRGVDSTGSFCIQLAELLGCVVTATGRPAETEYLNRLGAHLVIDSDLRDASHDYDVVINTAGRDAAEKVCLLVKPRGHAVMISGSPDRREIRENGVIVSSVRPSASREDVEMLGRLVAAGAIKIPIDNEVALERAVELVTRPAAAHSPVGRSVLYVH
jgi:NADPH:quinone reductase-like Zn-dependent oxidoreductase